MLLSQPAVDAGMIACVAPPTRPCAPSTAGFLFPPPLSFDSPAGLSTSPLDLAPLGQDVLPPPAPASAGSGSDSPPATEAPLTSTAGGCCPPAPPAAYTIGQQPPAAPGPAPGYLDTAPNRVTYGEMQSCRGRWRIRTCGCESVPVWIGGCGRKSCPFCGLRKASVRGAQVYDRIHASGYQHIQFLVVTVPPALRPGLSGPTGAKRWTKLKREMWRRLKNLYGATWAYERSHPCGDDGEEFAPHANFIFVQRGWKGELPHAAIRADWAGILGWEGPVDVFLEYVNLGADGGIAQLRHHVRYNERHFPLWIWPGCHGRWYGKAPGLRPDVVAKRAKGVCPCCGRAYRIREAAGEELVGIAIMEDLLLHGKPLTKRILRGCATDGDPPECWPAAPAPADTDAIFANLLDEGALVECAQQC